MSEKYEMLKDAIKEFEELFGHETGFGAIVEIVKDIDRLEINNDDANDTITKDEIMAERDPKKRINLIAQYPKLFK